MTSPCLIYNPFGIGTVSFGMSMGQDPVKTYLGVFRKLLELTCVLVNNLGGKKSTGVCDV